MSVPGTRANARREGSEEYKPAVEIGEKPFMHIHIETIKRLKPGCKVLILFTYQRRSGVCRIYMDPDLWVVLQHFNDLREVINRACCRRAECHCQVEWFQSLRLQLFDFLPEERAGERVV